MRTEPIRIVAKACRGVETSVEKKEKERERNSRSFRSGEEKLIS